MSYVRDGIVYLGSDDTTHNISNSPTYGLVNWGSTIMNCQQRTITNSTDSGNVGEICNDASAIYVCVANNTWKRVTLDTY